MNGNINRGDFMRAGGTETFGIIDTFEHKYGIDSIPAIQLVNIHTKIGGNINKRYVTRIPEYGFWQRISCRIEENRWRRSCSDETRKNILQVGGFWKGEIDLIRFSIPLSAEPGVILFLDGLKDGTYIPFRH